MEDQEKTEKLLHDLIQIIHFTEDVSAKIHGALDEAKIHRIIMEEFARLGRYTASILFLTEDGSALRIAGTSLTPRQLKIGEKVSGLRLKEYKIDLDRSSIYRRVIKGGETVQVRVNDTIGELFPRALAYLISKTLGYEKKFSILTPLKKYGEIIGVLAMSSTGVAEHFIPSVRNLARHISAALELADKEKKRSQAEEALREACDKLEVRVKEQTRELVEVNEKLQEEHRLLQILMDSIPDSIYFKDSKNRFVMVSKAKAEHLGTSPEKMIGKTDFDFFSEEVARKAFTDDSRVMESGKPLIDKVEKIAYSDGKKHWVSATKIPWYNERGKIIGTIGISRDITRRRKAEEEVAYMATHDALTALPNRVLFNDRLSLAVARAQREGKKVAVMMLDLDWFKRVNDSLGHRIGDRLLQAVGNRLKDILRETDTVARMGGDEFLLLLPEIPRTEDAGKIAQKILKAFQEPFAVDEHKLNITTSIGIAIYPEHKEDAKALISCADIAMYQVKKFGRNSYQLYNPNMGLETSR